MFRRGHGQAGADAGILSGCGAGAGTALRGAVERPRHAGSPDCGDRALRSAGLRGGTADARNRHTHGAGGGVRPSPAERSAGCAGSIAIGFVGAMLLARLVSSLLYGVSSTDPATCAGVAGILIVVGALAAFLPARRASRVDPLVALRYEERRGVRTARKR